jgi:TonB family protein
MPALMLMSRTPVAALIAVPQWSVVRLPVVIESPWPQRVLMCLYFSVCAVLLLRQGMALIKVFALRRRATRLHAQWTGQLDVRVSDELETPATIGSTIVLPRHFSAWSELACRAVMEHERTHVQHCDFVVLSLAHLHRALFWFNPLAWWLPQRLAVLGEHLSDDAALSAIGDRDIYARLLVAFASRGSLPHGVVAMAHPANITARVRRIVMHAGIPDRPGALQRAVLMSGILSATLLAAGCDGRVTSDGKSVIRMPPTGADQPLQLDQAPRSNRANPLSWPQYPAAARRLGQQGTVILLLHVLPDGRVDGVQLESSSGFESLDLAAAQEAWKWTLDPAIAAGRTVAAWGQFAVTFKLQD